MSDQFLPNLMSAERGPMLALDNHIDLLRWWQRSVYAQSFGEYFSNSIAQKNPGSWSTFPHERFSDYMAQHLDRAETVFVDAPIVEDLWGWAQNNDRIEVLLPQDFFAKDQYIWLDDPIRIHDANGTRCTIRVICAFLTDDGAVLLFFNDRTHEDDDITWQTIAQGNRNNYDPSMEPRTPIFHIQPVRWGIALAADLDSIYGRGGYLEENYASELIMASMEDNAALIRFLIALGDFMTDQIPFRRITNRPGVRRWERAKVGFPAEVRVVDLRVVEANPERNEVHGVVNWTHRWRSRAHIRRIRDKSTGEIKKIVPVRASVKGPAHLPLIERDTVFNVRR